MSFRYKGYTGGRLEFDDEADIFHGRVLGLVRDGITFEGRSVEELKRAFQDSVEDYLEWCAQEGAQPEVPFSGTITVQMEPDLHRRIVEVSQTTERDVNEWILDCIRHGLHKQGAVDVENEGSFLSAR